MQVVNNLRRLQKWLRAQGCDGLLIPSTDEYLSEFAQPFARRLRWTTGFCGSTGLSIVLQDRAALFLDRRYRLQGERDTAEVGIEILDAAESTKQRWLTTYLHLGERLAIDARLHSYPDVERTVRFAAAHGIQVIMLAQNAIDELWGTERPPAPASAVIDYPTEFAGTPAAEKIVQLREWLSAAKMDCHLLADPEDVAWLLNVRTYDSLNPIVDGWHVVPIPLSRVLVEATGNVFWFVENSRLDPALSARLQDSVTIMDPTCIELLLVERATRKVVGANLPRTPHHFASIVGRVGTLKHDPVVAHRRWRKQPIEVQRAREGHYRDGKAVIRFLAWLQRMVRERTITEIQAAQKLTEYRSELPGYQGPSMPSMSASGASGAIAHYIPTEHSDRKLNDHPIYWMDSGGQYYGCSTDNTVCIALDTPEARHIRAHTLVVKGFIALARARFPVGIYSSQLDSFARQHLWHEGMDYGHGTGHGVGNFMNIHEGPYIRKEPDHPMVVPMEAGMIVSNEPAYYSDEDFGIRIESHLVATQSNYDGFLEFETLSRLPIDPRLINATMLTQEEKQWLAHYHLEICKGYEGVFDIETSRWLKQLTDLYVAMAAGESLTRST